MADGFEVEQATLHQVAREIVSAKDDISGHLSTVRGAAEILGAAWTGQAASAFTNLMHRWDLDAKQLTGAMDDIAALLNKTANAHEMNDADSMNVLNRIDGSVGSILNPNS